MLRAPQYWGPLMDGFEQSIQSLEGAPEGMDPEGMDPYIWINALSGNSQAGAVTHTIATHSQLGIAMGSVLFIYITVVSSIMNSAGHGKKPHDDPLQAPIMQEMATDFAEVDGVVVRQVTQYAESVAISAGLAYEAKNKYQVRLHTHSLRGNVSH